MAYGDLNSVTVLETADDRSIEPPATQRLTPMLMIGGRAQVPKAAHSGDMASTNNRRLSALGTRKPMLLCDGRNCRQPIMAVLGSTADAS